MVPMPHPDFEDYQVLASKSTGVCAILATTQTITNDAYGEGVRKLFFKLQMQIASSYGIWVTSDHLKAGALWKEDKEWVMALYQNEREYKSDWDILTHAKLKDHIQSISLFVRALS